MKILKINNLKLRPCGVDYGSPSPSRPLPVEFNGQEKFISLPLAMGNLKLDKSVGIFDLLSVYTCPNCEKCARRCYARKAERCYPAVWNKRLMQTSMAYNNLKTTMERIIWQIRMQRIKLVRIHSSGDFWSQDYADMWSEIAKANPTARFYCYTKSPFRPAASNLNIVESILPNGELNFGDIETVQGLSRAYHAPVCPATWGRGKVVCGKDCQLCMHNKYVVFKEH